MLSEQILTRKVVDCLRDNHNIRLNLPNLFHSIDSKVTLKYLKSFPIAKHQNRYKILVDKTEELLRKNLLNLQKIKMFSEDFFNTITEDIIILQQNQKLRKRIPLAKDQILFKKQQISGFQQNIKTQSLLINDKEDVLTFISVSLKNYLTKLNVVSQEYNAVNRLQIFTSINIDDLYRDADEDDYRKHFSPLLQVLHKLKSNMIRLYQQIESCDPYDVPLRCVNFLANCKNLIQELEPFLLNQDCAFNRLIFYVVKCQKQNIQIVASNYEQALNFCREITSDLFKSYFLGFMFKDSYRQIRDCLQSSRQQLLKVINEEELPQVKMQQILRAQIVRLESAKQKIKQVKRIIGTGKDGFMKAYVRKKECKKLSLIGQCKQEQHILRKMIQKFTKLFQVKKQVKKLQDRQIQESSKIIKQIRTLQKINDIRQVLNENKQNIAPHKRFQNTFFRLQQLMLQVSQLKGLLQIQSQAHQHQKGHHLLIQYIQRRVQNLSTINTNYLLLQTKLLNTFMTIQNQTEKLQQQSLEIKEKTTSQLEEFFEIKLKKTIGFEITNEDNHCEDVKIRIMELGKAQYLIKQWRKDNRAKQIIVQTNKKDEDEIKFYRNNLQWLLILFQGSMDQKILEMIMDKLDFQAQDSVERQKKVQQLINQLSKYLNDLKSLIKSHPLSQIHPKIYKIIKDRIQLYQIIFDIYSQCLLVFKQTRKKDLPYNIQNKGIMLFDQQVFKYVLMIYQFRNKLRMQMEELKELMLPPRTRNYLIDELYEPFAIRFGQFVNYKEDELLSFTLRLQHALNIQLSQKKIITLFQESLANTYNGQYFSNLQNLCREMAQIKHENDLVNNLENQPVIVHNLSKFKQLVQPNFQYYRLAEEISKDIQRNDDMRLAKKLDLKNERVASLRNMIAERWQQHKNRNQPRVRGEQLSRMIKTNTDSQSIINKPSERGQVQSRILNMSRQQ